MEGWHIATEEPSDLVVIRRERLGLWLGGVTVWEDAQAGVCLFNTNNFATSPTKAEVYALYFLFIDSYRSVVL